MRELSVCSSEQFDQLKRCVPELFDGKHQFKILYIGASEDYALGSHELAKAGHILICVDVVPEYVEWAKGQPQFKHAIEGDVRSIAEIVGKPNGVDAVYWRHGPEHIPREDLEDTIRGLEYVASEIVVMACPHGYVADHNPAKPGMKHLCVLELEDFRKLGYNVDLLPARSGAKRGGGTTLLSWKYLS